MLSSSHLSWRVGGGSWSWRAVSTVWPPRHCRCSEPTPHPRRHSLSSRGPGAPWELYFRSTIYRSYDSLFCRFSNGLVQIHRNILTHHLNENCVSEIICFHFYVSFTSPGRLRQGRPCYTAVFSSALLNVCLDWTQYKCTLKYFWKVKKVKLVRLKLIRIPCCHSLLSSHLTVLTIFGCENLDRDQSLTPPSPPPTTIISLPCDWSTVRMQASHWSLTIPIEVTPPLPVAALRTWAGLKESLLMSSSDLKFIAFSPPLLVFPFLGCVGEHRSQTSHWNIIIFCQDCLSCLLRLLGIDSWCWPDDVSAVPAEGHGASRRPRGLVTQLQQQISPLWPELHPVTWDNTGLWLADQDQMLPSD